jgi:hypothetical protein
VAVGDEQERGGQAVESGPEDEDVCHRLDRRPRRRPPTSPSGAQVLPAAGAHRVWTPATEVHPSVKYA